MASAEELSIREELTPPFEVREPLGNLTPFVFCSPHSGRIYPQCFLDQSRLDAMALRRSEDCYVDELFIRAASRGATLLVSPVSARLHRCQSRALRTRSGTFRGAAARLGKCPLGACCRRSRHDRPHRLGWGRNLRRTAGLVGCAAAHRTAAQALPCRSAQPVGSGAAQFRLRHSDRLPFDAFGAHGPCRCPAARFRHRRPLRDIMRSAADEADPVGHDRSGLRGAAQPPYAGGYITEHYGRPLRGVHAVQLEINRGLYMDEKTLEKTPRFMALERDMLLFAKQLFAEVRRGAGCWSAGQRCRMPTQKKWAIREGWPKSREETPERAARGRASSPLHEMKLMVRRKKRNCEKRRAALHSAVNAANIIDLVERN